MDYNFFLVGASVVEVTSNRDLKIWPLDHYNEKFVSDWRDGKWDPASTRYDVPAGECIAINTLCSLDGHLADSARPLQFLGMYQGKFISELADEPFDGKLTPRLALHEALWRAIPEGVRPRPPGEEPLRKQEYRLQLIAQTQDRKVTALYVGFHVEIIDKLADGKRRVQFYSWMNQKIDQPVVIDLKSSTIGASYSAIDENSAAGQSGSLFVLHEAMSSISCQLGLAKVPFGGRQ